MAKTYKEKVIPKSIQTVLDKMTCDICKKETSGPDWGEGLFDVAETTIQLRTGSNYPECGSGEEYSFHICPDCFKKELIPFFKSFGGYATFEEWDY